MKIKEIDTPDYLIISKLPTSEYVINFYVDCSHACKYFYACFMKIFTGHVYHEKLVKNKFDGAPE